MKTFRLQVLTVFIAIVLSAATCLAQNYVITDLGNLGGGSSTATSINNCGQIVGTSVLADGSQRAFLWDNGKMTVIGDTTFKPTDINNIGQVIGNHNVGVGIIGACLYSNFKITNIPTLGGERNYAYAINDLGQVVGYSLTSKETDQEHAFLWSGGLTSDLGAFGSDYHSEAYDINNSGVIVGESGGTGYSCGNMGNYSGYACVWNNGAISTIPVTDSPPSRAYGINNNGQIVGIQGTLDYGAQKSFLYSGNQFKILDGPHPYPGVGSPNNAFSINDKSQVAGCWWPQWFTVKGATWDSNGNGIDLPVQRAVSINNKGQIVGTLSDSNASYSYLLTPVGNCQAYQVKLPTCTPVQRLEKWDDGKWVPVMAGDLSSGNIHVLVHGWGAGLRAFANNGGKIWDEKDPKTGVNTNSEQYTLLTNAAASIKQAAPGDIVVAFNWLDLSATDSDWPNEAWRSRATADIAGVYLKDALKDACDFSGNYDDKLQLMGVSHGARVAAFATKELYAGGKSGSVVVDQLTLGDSPENTLDLLGYYYVSKNNLKELLSGIKIGKTVGTTFVDNYYSSLGESYGFNNIVNVKLNPDKNWSSKDKHIYPINWYTGANLNTDNLGVAWSPLDGDLYKTLGSSYEQDWLDVNGNTDKSRQYILKETSPGPAITSETQTELNLTTLLTQGLTTGIPKGMRLFEHSPAYWHTGFTKNPNDITIEFTYQFLNPGDGDQLGLWIDDQLRFIITGDLVGTETLTSDIDISDLTDGDHILSVALHNYGEANASVEVSDFIMISVPEPSTLYLLCAATIFVATAKPPRRKLTRA